MALRQKTTSRVVQALCAATSDDTRTMLLRSGNPHLAGEMERLTREPSRIKRFSVDGALEALDYIDDPALIAHIVAADNRDAVRLHGVYRAAKFGVELSLTAKTTDTSKATARALKAQPYAALTKLRSIGNFDTDLVAEWIESVDDAVLPEVVTTLLSIDHTSSSPSLLCALIRTLSRPADETRIALISRFTRRRYATIKAIRAWDEPITQGLAELCSSISPKDRTEITASIGKVEHASRPVSASSEARTYWETNGDLDLLLWAGCIDDLSAAVDEAHARHDDEFRAAFIRAARSVQEVQHLLQEAISRGWLSTQPENFGNYAYSCLTELLVLRELPDHLLTAVARVDTDQNTTDFLTGVFGPVSDSVIEDALPGIQVSRLMFALSRVRDDDDDDDEDPTHLRDLEPLTRALFERSEEFREDFTSASLWGRSPVVDRYVVDLLRDQFGTNEDLWSMFFTLLDVAENGTVADIALAASCV